MKNVFTIVLVVCLVVLVRSAAHSQERGFGLGIILGEPTGISMKGWVSESNAIDGGIAWSFRRETSLHIHADYLWHKFDVFETKESIPLYYGIGGRIKVGRHEDALLGARVVVGIGFLLRDAPIDFFFEVAPILDLVPSTEMSGNGGIGARYWFR